MIADFHYKLQYKQRFDFVRSSSGLSYSFVLRVIANFFNKHSGLSPPLSVLTCAAALLEVKESSCTTVAFGSGDARLAPTLTGFVTVKRLGTKRVAVTRDTRSACADAVSLRLEEHRQRQREQVVEKR